MLILPGTDVSDELPVLLSFLLIFDLSRFLLMLTTDGKVSFTENLDNVLRAAETCL